MTQFNFRFAVILQLKRRQSDDVRLAIAKCLAAVESIDASIVASQQQQSELLQSPNLRRVGRISLETLQYTRHQSAFLRTQIEQLDQRRQKQEIELSVLQDQLVAAQLEVARYEKLEASDESKFRKDQLRIANRHEIAARRHQPRNMNHTDQETRGLGTSIRSTTI